MPRKHLDIKPTDYPFPASDRDRVKGLVPCGFLGRALSPGGPPAIVIFNFQGV